MDAADPLSNQALTQIRDWIVRGKLAFGQRLSDRTLAAELEISRTPVKQALQRLAAEGLVTIRPQSGSFVMSPDAEAIRTVCEMRAILECGALRLAAGHDPDRLAAALSVPLAGAALALEEGDLARAEAMDAAFHEAIVGASDNALLFASYRGIASQVGALRHRLPRNAKRMATALAHHRRILDLALAGRLAEAEAELAAHVRRVQAQASAKLPALPIS